jgi:tetratricopeptide (TPR) repeat protein
MVTEYTFMLHSLEGPQQALAFIDSETPAPVSEKTNHSAYVTALAQFYQYKAVVAQEGGVLPVAEAAANAGLAVCRQYGEVEVLPGLMHIQSKLYRDRMDYTQAVKTVRQAIAGFKKSGNVFHEVTAKLNLGWYLLADNRYLEALQVFGAVEEGHSTILLPIQRVYLLAGQAIALSHLDQEDQAEQAAGEALQFAEANGSGELLGLALLAVGWVGQDPARLSDAVSQWRALERPYWLLLTLEALVAQTGGSDAVIAGEIQALKDTLQQ